MLQAEENHWQDPQGIVASQARHTLSLVNELLAQYPPAVTTPSPERKAALYLLDQLMHDTRVTDTHILSHFLNERMQAVVDSLRQPAREGITAYKLYNDGWIIRTPSVTIGWDIYRGRLADGSGPLMADSVAQRLVEACDIMFLTHNHGDHIDPVVVDMMLTAGRPVVAPTEVLSHNEGVTHTRRDTIWSEQFTAANGSLLNATIVPGHQDHLQNNIYVVTTPDGLTICSTGDQWLESDEPMVYHLQGRVPSVNLFIPICWAYDLPALCQSFGAQLVITGHENELGHHSIDHREPYWLSLDKTARLPMPHSVMTWGESIHLIPQ